MAQAQEAHSHARCCQPGSMATVKVHRLTYWGSNDEFLLKGVSCVARPGELLGILGGSGTGKRYGGSCVPLWVHRGPLRSSHTSAGCVRVSGADMRVVANCWTAYCSTGACCAQTVLLRDLTSVRFQHLWRIGTHTTRSTRRRHQNQWYHSAQGAHCAPRSGKCPPE